MIPISWRLRLLAAVTATALAAMACGGQGTTGPGTTSPSSPAVTATSPGTVGPSSPGPFEAPLLPASPTELPEFTPTTFRELLGQLRGVPVVVNVWASWCGPCVQEAPALSRLSREYEGEIQFLGVDIQDQRVPARAFIAEYQWPYPSVFDTTGAIRDDLGFIGQPVTVLFNQVGRQIWVQSGPIQEDELAITLSAVLEV